MSRSAGRLLLLLLPLLLSWTDAVRPFCFSFDTCYGVQSVVCEVPCAQTNATAASRVVYALKARIDDTQANLLTRGTVAGFEGSVAGCPLDLPKEQCTVGAAVRVSALCTGEDVFSRLIYFGKRICSLATACEPMGQGLSRQRDYVEAAGSACGVPLLVHDPPGPTLLSLAGQRLYDAFGSQNVVAPKRIMFQLAEAVRGLHGRGIVHGALGLGNFALDKPAGSADNRIKISNWQAAVDLSSPIYGPASATLLLTNHELVSPEAFYFSLLADRTPPSPASPAARLITPAADIWSLGLLFYQISMQGSDTVINNNAKLFSSRGGYTSFANQAMQNPSMPRRHFDTFSLVRNGPPFFREIVPPESFGPCQGQAMGGTPEQTVYGVIPGPLIGGTACLPRLDKQKETEAFMDLLKRMLDPDYRYRITAKQILDHCFFHGYCTSRMFQQYDRGNIPFWDPLLT